MCLCDLRHENKKKCDQIILDKTCIQSRDDANGPPSIKKASIAARLAGFRNVSIANTDDTRQCVINLIVFNCFLLFLICIGEPACDQLVLRDDRRNHARLQLLARQVVILQVAVFVAEGLAVVKHAGKHEGHVGLRLKRVARVVDAVAALVARLQLVGLHDLRGVVRQELAVLRVGRYAGLLLNALVDDGARLPVGIVATVCHDWREVEMDVVGSGVASGPAHFTMN